MRFSIVSFVVALTATAKAYNITSPGGICVDISQPLVVNWTYIINEPYPNISFAITNYQGGNPNVDVFYENLVVDGTRGTVTLPELNTTTALEYSQNNGGKGFSIYMGPPNSPPPHMSSALSQSRPAFRIVAPGASTINCQSA